LSEGVLEVLQHPGPQFLEPQFGALLPSEAKKRQQQSVFTS